MAAHLSRLAKYHIADFVNYREVSTLPREWREMRDYDWNLGMLVGLSDSTLVEELDVLFVREECLTLLGRFEEGLVRRQVQKLRLWIMDPLLNALIGRHNFFGRPAIRQLKKLELFIQHLNAPLEPYWLPALYEPGGCPHLAIHYAPEQRAQETVDVARIHSALRLILKEFETSGRDLAVEHFSLTCYGGIPSISRISSQRWNVYYYETADKKKGLTLFVPAEGGRRSIHVKRGKITDFS